MKTIENPQTDEYGTQRYYNSNKQLHRDNDQPAVIWDDGTKYWYKNGQQHRDNDQPAVIYVNGEKWWYKNGQQHRDNDQPAVIYANGSKCWYKNGQRHRDNDQPAVIYVNGEKWWYKNGQQHRDNDQPAVIYANGEEQYYLKNINLTHKEYKSIIDNKITIKQITKETNIEKRRLYIEYYGLEKYIIYSKAKIISQDEYGILYKKEQQDDEDIIMVKVKNSTPEHDGSHKFYFIRVPPDIISAKAAVAWTFGMLEDEYSPEVES